ncbi:hypothetical protein EDD37DRAFT_39534 [Exophiala viscosa]|uniref:uncharacterized protein n=1 Tax=Exophiala viscosa TaxID=2486360 RepID=UPI00219FA7B9|nr:hypothetical protein EDD37DRAFT_39534 [Exophiala viscosa]
MFVCSAERFQAKRYALAVFFASSFFRAMSSTATMPTALKNNMIWALCHRPTRYRSSAYGIGYTLEYGGPDIGVRGSLLEPYIMRHRGALDLGIGMI